MDLINWILKQIFYFRYLVLKQGNTFIYYPSIYTFQSDGFEGLSWEKNKWLKYLPWDYPDNLIINWNTYKDLRQSENKGFSQLFGKFYFKARLDGLINDSWPAIWLLEIGEEYYYEIDIELFKTHFGYTAWYNHKGGQEFAEVKRANFRSHRLYRNLQKKYHLFLIDWNKERIKMYIDGILCARFKNEIHKELQIIISHASMNQVIVKQ